MRGIRYIAFPPVIFAAPEAPPASAAGIGTAMEAVPAATPPLAMPGPAAAPVIVQPVMAPAVSAPPAMPGPAATPVIAEPRIAAPAMPPPAGPGPAMRRLAEWAGEAAEPPARLRPLAELTAAESLEPPEAGALTRRYALLNDIAVELRPRRPRPRAAKRAWP